MIWLEKSELTFKKDEIISEEFSLAVLSVDQKKAECIEMETKLYQVQNQIFNLKCGKYKTSKDNSFP